MLTVERIVFLILLMVILAVWPVPFAIAQESEESEVEVIIDVPLPPKNTVITPLVTQSLNTDWRDSIGVLSVGYLIDGERDRQRRRLEPFRRAMERRIGLRVLFRPAETLNELINMQINRRIQYAIHSASSYVTTRVKCKCVEVLAVPTDKSGARGIYAVLLAPFSGAVRSLGDLKGRRLAITAAPATITRLLPLKDFEAAGYDEQSDVGTLVDVANPVEGWRKVMADEADAVIGWSTLQGDLSQGYSSGTLRHLISVTGLAKSTDMRVVWQSSLVPNGPHVIRSDVPTQLKVLLRDFLINLGKSNRYAYDGISPELSGGFIEIAENDFNTLLTLAKPKAPN